MKDMKKKTKLLGLTLAASVSCLAAQAQHKVVPLEHFSPLEGLEVVVIGHSEIVGKPIAFLLMAEGATVTVCHHMTRSVPIHSRRADAIFVAVGKARLITGEMIKPGAAVIDIGINVETTPDGERVVGDVDYESASEAAGWITPVPGGVGPVTVAMLMRNTLVALKQQKAAYESALSPRKFT